MAILSSPAEKPAHVTRFRPRMILVWALILCDVLGVNVGFVGSYVLLYPSQIQSYYKPPSLHTAVAFLVALNVACAFIFWAYRLYTIKRAGSRVDEAYKIFVATAVATLVASVIGMVVGLRFTPWNLVGAWLLTLLLVVLIRNAYRSLVYHARTRGFDTARALIIGSGDIGRSIASIIGKAPHLGYEV